MLSIIDRLIYAIMLSNTMKSITIKKIQSTTHPETKKLFWNLFSSTRGAANRIKIMSLLRNIPSNPNQLAKNIEVDYKGVTHHLKALEKNSLVEKYQNSGMTTYFVSPLFEQNEQVFDEISALA